MGLARSPPTLAHRRLKAERQPLRVGRPGVRIEPPESGLVPGLPVADFRYVVFGLSGCSASEYLARPEPLALAADSIRDLRLR